MEVLQTLAGFTLIAGLFLMYWRERRAKRRPPETHSAPSVPEVATKLSAEPATVRGSSPNWGAPILFGLLLFGAATHRDSWRGFLWQALYFGFVGFALYSTFSPKELADEQVRRPGTTRADIYWRIGVPYVLVPTVGWIVTIPFGYSAGPLIPVLPWVGLIVLAMINSRGGGASPRS